MRARFLGIRSFVGGLLLCVFATACQDSNFKSSGDKSNQRNAGTVDTDAPGLGQPIGSTSNIQFVDCNGMTAEQCEQKVREAVALGNGNNSVVVSGCSDNGSGVCSNITNIGTSSRQVVLDTGNGGNGTIGGDGGFKVKDIAICVGGRSRAVYPFAKEDYEAALACYRKVQRGGYINDSDDCQSYARIGSCRTTGTLAEAQQEVKRVIPANCQCLFTNIAKAMKTVVWD